MANKQLLRDREDWLCGDHRYKSLFENNLDAIFSFDLNGHFVDANPACEIMWGFTAKELYGKSFVPLVAPEYVDVAVEHFRRAAHGEPGKCEIRVVHKDGHAIDLSVVKIPITVEGEIVGVYDIAKDITELKRAGQMLKESEHRYKSLFENNPDAVFSLDLEGNFTSANQACERVSGYSVSELLETSITRLTVEDDREATIRHFEDLSQGIIRDRQTEIIHKDGRIMDLSITSVPIFMDGKMVGIYGIAKDITELNRSRETIQRMAFHDSLTNLPNRALLKKRIAKAVSGLKPGYHVAVMLLDLDQFKGVNETLGHSVGDELLKQVATRLKQCVREGDTISRLGGDEFTILLSNVSAAGAVERIARKVIHTFRAPWNAHGRTFHITASMGIALAPNDGLDAEHLMKHADTAMYYAKANGKNTHAYYQPTMNDEITHRFVMETALRIALDEEQFVLHYQPQVDTHSMKVVGAEALIRWHHPENGLLSPAEFIPLAEETGLIIPVGRWVLRTACEQAKEWQTNGNSPVRVAVNISSRQLLQLDFAEQVKQILEETELEPGLLELEITESTMMHDVETALEMLYELRGLGVQLAIDDFGTGYSSLSYLKRFPIDRLKVDQSFVSDITKDMDSKSIAAAIIAMARNLNLKVIAEGVESETQLKFLRDHHCNEVQGFLFGRPVPAAALLEQLR